MPSKVSGFLYTCCLYIYFTFSQITIITISVEIIILNLYLKTLTFKKDFKIFNREGSRHLKKLLHLYHRKIFRVWKWTWGNQLWLIALVSWCQVWTRDGGDGEKETIESIEIQSIMGLGDRSIVGGERKEKEEPDLTTSF